MQYKNLTVQKLNHATVKIKNSKVIYFDPFKVLEVEAEDADIVLISHEHFDHCSPEDLKKIIKAETILSLSLHVAIIWLGLGLERSNMLNPEIF